MEALESKAHIDLSSHIFLIGFMGVGKSSVGQHVAKLLDLNFMDIDEDIARDLKCSIADFFKMSGEPAFRQLELDYLRALGGQPGSIISCGGGIVTLPESCEELKRQGFVIWLQATFDTSMSRISDKSTRPLLTDRKSALQLYEGRQPKYRECADLVFDTEGLSCQEVADGLVSALRGLRNRSC
jgi:shikimate kinase